MSTTNPPIVSNNWQKWLERPLILSATSFTFLKPRFREAFRPIAAWLARSGVTANMVTLASLGGSLLVSVLLCGFARGLGLFALLPVWLLARMACATIDGTLATEFGQKSRVGGILNEVGDIVSDAALFLPFAFVAPFSCVSISLVILFACLSEVAGMAGPLLGGTRQLEGPFGKADRTIALCLAAVAVAVFHPLPYGAWFIVPAFAVGALITIWNRLVAAMTERAGPH